MAMNAQDHAVKARTLLRAAMRELKQLELVDDTLSGCVLDTVNDAYTRLGEHAAENYR